MMLSTTFTGVAMSRHSKFLTEAGENGIAPLLGRGGVLSILEILYALIVGVMVFIFAESLYIAGYLSGMMSDIGEFLFLTLVAIAAGLFAIRTVISDEKNDGDFLPNTRTTDIISNLYMIR